MKWKIIEKKYALTSITKKDLKVSTREAQVEMFRFYLQWSKAIQYAANSNKENQKLTHIQNYDK